MKSYKYSHRMENKPTSPNQTVFEQIKLLDTGKSEYWTSRDLSRILEYSEYRHFKPVINKAKEACRNSGYEVDDHFEDMLEMVSIGSGAERPLNNVKLSRYA